MTGLSDYWCTHCGLKFKDAGKRDAHEEKCDGPQQPAPEPKK